MAKIMLIGAAYSEHKGASALITAAVANLQEHIPGSKFFFCSVTPQVDQQNTCINAVSVIPCVLKNSTLELLLAAAWLRLTKRKISRWPMTEYLKETEIVVDISGDSYASLYGKTAVLAMGLRVISAKLARKPIVFFCQSVGPFNGKIDVFFAKRILHLVNLVIAREVLTADYLLKAFDVKAPVHADQAFLLKPSFNHGQVQLSKNKPLIGVNISQLIDSKFKLENSTNQYRIMMVDFIDALIERYNADVLIIPEVKKQEKNAYDDIYMSRVIVNRLKHKDHVSIAEADYSASELKGIVSNCDLVISPRFHIVIFALSSGVPAISIAYSPKTHGIMAMLKQSDYVLDYNTLTLPVLLEKTDSLWLNKTKVRQTLKSSMDDIQASAKKAAELVRKMLDNENGDKLPAAG
jgi:polysaccharide pyruvyl transferase WcaK-like protein